MRNTLLRTNILNSKQPLILYLFYYGLFLSAASHSGPLQHFKSLKLLLWLIILLGHIKIRLIRLIIDCTTFRYVGAGEDILFRGSGGRDRRRKWCVYYEYNDECNNMSLLCLSYSNMIITLPECAIIPGISCIEIYIFIYNITMMHCIICFYDRYQLQYV